MEFKLKTIEFCEFSELDNFIRLIGLNMRRVTENESILRLAREIFNDQNAMLCPGNVNMDSHIFKKLEGVAMAAPNFKLEVEIYKSENIAERIYDLIYRQITELISSSAGLSRLGKAYLVKDEDKLHEVLDSVFANPEFSYTFFEPHYIRTDSKNFFKGFVKPIVGGFNRGLFATAMQLRQGVVSSREILTALMKVGFLLGALRLAYAEEKKRPIEARTRKVANLLSRYGELLDLEPAILKTLKILALSKPAKDINPDAMSLENIVYNNILVTDQFLTHLESGHLSDLSLFSAIEKLFLMSKKDLLEERYVEMLSKWIRKPAIFRMHQAIWSVEHRCTRGKNESSNAVPYPNYGQGLPSMFICSKNDTNCPHISTMLKRINVSRPSKKLLAGAYTKCDMLSKTLHNYYRTDLENIRKEFNHNA